MIGNDHVRFGRGPSGAGPACLAPRRTAYLASCLTERLLLAPRHSPTMSGMGSKRL